MIRISTKPISYYFLILFVALLFMGLGISWWVLAAPTLLLTALTISEVLAVRRLRARGGEQVLSFKVNVPATLDLGVVVTAEIGWEWHLDSRCDLVAWALDTQEVVELLPVDSDQWPVTKFTIHPRRLGTWKITSVQAKFRSPLGFWTRSLRFEVPLRQVRVHPPLHTLSTEDFLDLFSQAPRLVEGRRRRAASREAELFHSIRRFQTGDPVRSIDARRSALIGQPMVRTFEAHRDHHLIICLDLGRGMLGSIGSSRKLDYYISAMDHLIRSAIAQGDRVSVIGFDQQPRFQYRASKNLAAFAQLIETADQLQASPHESDFAKIGPWIQTLSPTRAIVVLMTDVERPSVQENLHESLRGLTHKHLTAILGLSEPLNDPQESLNELRSEVDDRKLISDPNYANLLYALNIRTQLQASQKQWTQFGANCVVVDRTRWMAATHALYTQLRASQFA